MKTIVIGGVAGGASTAARLRRMDEKAEIIILERGPYISFANCGLPYFIGEVISERDKLLVVTPEMLREMMNIDSRVLNEVIAIDRKKKSVTVRNLETGETYEETYDKLVLSPGAGPIVPPLPGVDLPGVFTLRNLPDMDKIKAFVDEKKPARAVVVGGGFIGLEIAENLVDRGVEVTLIEMLDQVMAPIDYEMAALVHQHLTFKRIRLALGDGLKSIGTGKAGWMEVELSSGRKVDTELVILSIGVRPENKLAKDAGLELGIRGTVVTNEHMQTSDPDIYAVGDVAQVTSRLTDTATALALAGPASREGRVAADHMAGNKKAKFPGVIGTSVVKVFDLTVASVGMNAKALQQAEIPFQNVIIHASNHAGYYPGASPMAFKLL